MLLRASPPAAYSVAMDRLAQALHAAATPPRALPQRASTLLVIGGGGVLGAALLARALGSGRFERVQALVARDVASALRDFEPLPLAALQRPLRADSAAVVFERARRNNGRDEAFVQPQPQQLAPLATQLHAGGVRRLLVLVPHAPALLPQALQSGLASLDEAHVAALGFEHVLLLRAAQSAAGTPVGGWARRAAAGWLAQLAWMVPQREQPLRARRLAELVVELAWRLPQSAPATRVLAPQLLWQAAHAADSGAWLGAWLDGAPLPPVTGPAQRW